MKAKMNLPPAEIVSIDSRFSDYPIINLIRLRNYQLALADADTESSLIHIPSVIRKYACFSSNLPKYPEILMNFLGVFCNRPVRIQHFLPMLAVSVTLDKTVNPVLTDNRRVRTVTEPFTENVVCNVYNELWAYNEVDTVEAVDTIANRLSFGLT